MAQKTIRDKIWIQALNQVWLDQSAIERKEFIQNIDASEKTVRDALECMSSSPYLNKERRRGQVYYVPGPAFLE